MSKDNGGSAFPISGSEHGYPEAGMTLRDYFAGLAMQGFVANKDRPYMYHPDDDAEYAYQIADAMLKERAK